MAQLGYHNTTARAGWFLLCGPNFALALIQIIDCLPFSLSTYRLWHSFSILSLGVVIADSRGFATDLGFLPDMVSDARGTRFSALSYTTRGRVSGLHKRRYVLKKRSPCGQTSS